jgi:hypothetical protein
MNSPAFGVWLSDMKTTLALAAAITAAIVASAAAGAQTDGGQTPRPLEGALSGLHTVYSAQYGAETLTLSGNYRSPVLGAGTFVVNVVTQAPYVSECTFCPASVPVGGTAAFSSERGGFTGSIGSGSSVVYSQQPHGVSYDLALRLELNEGTRAFAKSNAEVNLTYSAGINFYGPTPEEWAFGSFNGFVVRPEP